MKMERKIYAVTALCMLAGLTAVSPCSKAIGQTAQATAQQAQFAPSGSPELWVDRAVKHELAMIQQDDLPLRYRTRKVDSRGDVTRVVIESQQGTLARLVERDGKPLTASEDAAERSRLNDILSSPQDFLKRKRRDGEGRGYAFQMVKLMPSAMLFGYAPGQPQIPSAHSRQVVIDFRPKPGFRPPNMVSEALTGLAGRLWIDEASGHLTRVEGHVLRPVNFGWGVIAKVYPGGTLELEQTCVDGKHWVSSHLVEDLTMREMMVKTVSTRTQMSAWDFQPLPASVSFEQAVHQLLDLNVPVR